MWVQSLGQKDPLEEGMAAHSFSCLKNPMDRGCWPAAVHRVAKNLTQLKRLGMCTSSSPMGFHRMRSGGRNFSTIFKYFSTNT